MVTIALFFLLAAGGAESPDDFVVDLEKYSGLWYEAARTPNSFQDNTPTEDGKRYSACFNTTAEYTLSEDGEIAVVNTCYRESPDGDVITDVAEGEARVQDGSGGRQLKVAFGSTIARFFMRLFTGGGANYWIYALGPVDNNGQYGWALVSGPDRDYLWVLTRERLISDELREKILARAREAGLPVDELIFSQRDDELTTTVR